MASYSSLTSRRIFSFRAIFDWKRSHQWPKYSWRADLFIHRLRNNVYYRWISSDLSCKWNKTANTRTPTVNPVAGEDFSHRKTSGSRTPTWNLARATKKETAAINSGAERTSLHEFRMVNKSNFKSKWKRFWIIRLKIWANIAVTKHVLLAD